MRIPLVLLLASAVAAAGADAPGDAALPVTIDERNSACVQTEDADPARAVALAQSVLDDLLRDVGASPERVRLTRRAGGILHRNGDRVGAVELYAQAVADAEAQGLEAERIPLLVNLGVLQSEFEEHARAQVNYEQALALMERLGDHRYEAPVRYNLGLTLAGAERAADAVPHLRRALELIRETGMGGPMQELGVTLALASSLQESGATSEAQALLERARAIQMPARDPSFDLQLTMIDAGQRAAAGDLEGALALIDAVDTGRLDEIQQWTFLKRRADLLGRLGRDAQAAAVLRRIIALRENYLRNQNHERLAALDSHLRDREQRIELERLQASADAQARRLHARERLQWATAIVGGLLLLFGGVVMLWQRRMNRRLYLASHTDPLTGLANRREMTRQLRASSLEPQGEVALLLIDIDLFKRINDDHGHDVGDRVLVAYAERLRASAGEGAIVSRWGGEEFLVLLPRCDAPRTRATAERLRLLLAEPIATSNGLLQAGASLGYANLPLPGKRQPDAWHYSLQLADSALYLAKRAGRDAWAGYWIERELPEWPAERLGREPHLARSLHIITPQSSRPLREAVVVAASAAT
jgi:diguanylate cyclase (GGDEF)-like protein